MRYPRAMPTSKRKDFTQTALDVVRQATGDALKTIAKPQKQTAPKVAPGAVKKAVKKS